jgi:hypothetical protein
VNGSIKEVTLTLEKSTIRLYWSPRIRVYIMMINQMNR